MPNFQHYTENDFTDLERKGKINNAINEYENLLKFKQKDWVLWDNNISKKKHPFLFYTYKGKFEIIVHKVNIQGDSSLDSIVKIENSSLKESPDVIYNGNEKVGVKFYQASNSDSLINRIFISCDNNMLNKNIIGDSIIDYNFFINSLSVRYEASAIRDFVVINDQLDLSSGVNKTLNLHFLLYKKNKFIYFILIYPREKSVILEDDLIYGILGINNTINNQS
ncbi:MAG: hypothetical protein H0W73_17070 [Bacteroidetes bacterium]|nr:hypothetical protein [Bacteroidota bacterium]